MDSWSDGHLRRLAELTLRSMCMNHGASANLNFVMNAIREDWVRCLSVKVARHVGLRRSIPRTWGFRRCSRKSTRSENRCGRKARWTRELRALFAIVIRDIWARYPILANKAKTEKAKNREGGAIREDWVRCLSVKVARHVGYDPTTNRWLTLPQCKEGRGIARNVLSRMSNDYMSQIRTVCRIPCRQCANWRVPNTRTPSLAIGVVPWCAKTRYISITRVRSLRRDWQ